MDDTFLTTEEVLAYLQVNLRTIYRLIKAGTIPAFRVGRQWRFRKRDIDAWLESQRSSGMPPMSPSTPAAASRRVSGRNPRILVVDDELTIRDLLSKWLAQNDYDVETAPDGRTALERLRAGAYDLLMIDQRMPGLDGLSVVREAKTFRQDLPVIMMTGYSSESVAIEALNLGVMGYLTKPFKNLQVLARVAKVIGEPADP